MTVHPFPTPPPPLYTHHVWYDTRVDSRLAMAVCGRLIDCAASVPHPTCPLCRQVLAEHDQPRPALEETPS